MSKVINFIVAGVAALVLLAAGLWYVWVVKRPEEVGVESVRTSWGRVDAQHSQMLTEVTFRNPYNVEVQLQNVRQTVFVNGQELGQDAFEPPTRLAPGGRAVQNFTYLVPTSFVGQWLKDHAAAGEETTFTVRGEGIVQIGGNSTRLEYEKSERWRSSLPRALADLENCERPRGEPCLVDSAASWTSIEGTPVLRVELRLRNPHDEALRLGARDVALLLHGTRVAHGASTGDEFLEARATKTLTFDLHFDYERLTQWWPTHVAACETSPASLRIGFDFEPLPKDTPPPTASTQPSPPPSGTTASPSASPSPSPTTSAPTTAPTSSPPTSSSSATTSSSSPPPSSSPSPSAEPSPTSGNGSFQESAAPEASNQTVEGMSFAAQAAAGRVEWDLGASTFRTEFACNEE